MQYEGIRRFHRGRGQLNRVAWCEDHGSLADPQPMRDTQRPKNFRTGRDSDRHDEESQNRQTTCFHTYSRRGQRQLNRVQCANLSLWPYAVKKFPIRVRKYQRGRTLRRGVRAFDGNSRQIEVIARMRMGTAGAVPIHRSRSVPESQRHVILGRHLHFSEILTGRLHPPPHPHSLYPHTWHFWHPSANSSCPLQSGHTPMKVSPGS
jgi:hypothetical protein